MENRIQSNVQDIIATSIIDRPLDFRLMKRRFRLYPETLGRSLVLGKQLQALDVNPNAIGINPTIEATMICRNQREKVCEILSICCTRNKKSVLNTSTTERRAKFFMDNMELSDMATLLLYVLTQPKAEDIIKGLGLSREQEEQRRIARITAKKSNSISFGGLSLYGRLIDVACERYGWSFDYVVWGISLVNLRMMIADAVNTTYLSEEDRKKAHITSGEETINAETTDLKVLMSLTQG